MTMADPTRRASPWVVLKFGGTSVSIARQLAKHRAVVQRDRLRRRRCDRSSCIPRCHGITDKLEKLLAAALRQSTRQPLMEHIEERHRQLARELGVRSQPAARRTFHELRQIAAGIALVGEVSDRTRARVMAHGELMATELGARSSRRRVSTSVDRCAHDAQGRGAAQRSAKASYLSATCDSRRMPRCSSAARRSRRS